MAEETTGIPRDNTTETPSEVEEARPTEVINDTFAALNINSGGDDHPHANDADKSHEKEVIAHVAQDLETQLAQLKEKEKERKKKEEETGQVVPRFGEEVVVEEEEEEEEEEQEEVKEEAKEEKKEEKKEVQPEVKEQPKVEEPPAPATPATPAEPEKPAAPATPATPAAPEKPAAAPAPASASRPALSSAAAKFAALPRPVAAPKKGAAAYGTMQVRPSAKGGAHGGNPKIKFNSLLRPKAKIAPQIKPSTVLVIDNGSAFVKAGVSGEALPRVVIPPVVGKKEVGNDKYIGFKAYEVNGAKLTNAIDIHHGKVNWDYLGDLFEHIFYDELRVDPLNHPVLLTELPDMTRKNKEKMCELMFEAFEVPSLYIANPAVLSLFSQGMVTGVVVDCGNRMQIVPVIDGYTIESARSQLVPGNINEHLARLLTERGYYFTSPTQMNIVRRIKERACYVAVDYAKETSLYSVKGAVPDATFTLPDGHVVNLGSERFRAPECLFDPNMVGIDRPGLHKAIFECVNKCPIDYRTELYSKIVLSGGSTLFPGLPERIKRELGFLLPQATHRRVNVVAPKNRKYSAWFGGSVYGTLSSFYDNCTWKDAFNEHGASCIHQGGR